MRQRKRKSYLQKNPPIRDDAIEKASKVRYGYSYRLHRRGTPYSFLYNRLDQTIQAKLTLKDGALRF